MTEQLGYRNPDQLERLTLDDLQALWELVPTDRQKAYRAAYDREVRNAGAIGSDELEQRVAAELLTRYRDAALVPVGTRWARAPQRVQDAARENKLLNDESAENAANSKPSPQLLAAFGLLTVIFVGFLLFRVISGRSSDTEIVVQPTMTPTPEVSPTATPLALEAQDDVITGGDSERAVAYPVNLQVVTADSSSPRVWVVQRRVVSAAEWNFDPNPDIASFVNGMSVRPVIGIPWSEDNAALFAAIDDGTIFNLTMNTGAVLHYEFASKTEVLRSDTRIFRQVGPGLVLLLIGETDDDGLPTGTRTLITATYTPQQELSRGGELTGAISEGVIGSALEMGNGTTITLRDVSTDESDTTGQQALLFELEVATGESAIETSAWRLELVDTGGQIYLPNIDGLDSVLPEEIPALAVIPVSAAYLVPANFLGGRLMIADGRGEMVAFRFSLETEDTPVAVQYDRVDVRLVSVTTVEGQITTRVRIYNGQNEAVSFTPDDIWLSLGYATDPPGPRNPAEGLQPFTLLPEQAVDLTLVWYRADEPYAALQVGGYRFSIQLRS